MRPPAATVLKTNDDDFKEPLDKQRLDTESTNSNQEHEKDRTEYYEENTVCSSSSHGFGSHRL
jgi:hypothetical protein